MKIVIQRHTADLQVFRALAVAQAAAAAAPGAEIFLECFAKYRRMIELMPGLKWKNPHHPFEVAERGPSRDPSTGKELPARPGGRLYDEIVTLEPDSPLELEFMRSGLPWWGFIKAKTRGESDFAAKLKIPDFPELADPPCPYRAGEAPKGYIVIAPLSSYFPPSAINANRVEEYAAAQCPGAPIFWISPDNVFLGDNRNLLRCDGFVSLAWILKNAVAVFAVNGLVSAMAQSTVGGQRLVRRYCHIRGRFEKGFERDSFLSFAKAIDTETARGPKEPACAIAAIAKDLSIETVQGFPAD
jgi:hypothetical protein